MRKQYRIFADNYSGFEVQCRSYISPFWHQPICNTHKTLSDAEAWAKNYAKSGCTIKLLGWLP